MIFVCIIIMIVAMVITFDPATNGGRVRGRGRRRKQKGLIAMLLDGQRRTERENGSHRGVMCGPGGSRRKKSSWF